MPKLTGDRPNPDAQPAHATAARAGAPRRRARRACSTWRQRQPAEDAVGCVAAGAGGREAGMHIECHSEGVHLFTALPVLVVQYGISREIYVVRY